MSTGTGEKLVKYQFSVESRAPSSGAEQTANPADLGTALFMLFAGCHLPQPLGPVARATVWACCPLWAICFFIFDGNTVPSTADAPGLCIVASGPGHPRRGSAESLRQEQALPGETKVTRGADRNFFGLIRRRDGEGGTEKADVGSGSARFPPPTSKHGGSSAPWERNPPKPRQPRSWQGCSCENGTSPGGGEGAAGGRQVAAGAR